MGMGPIITGGACALACAQAGFLGLARQGDSPGHEACPGGWLVVAFLLLLPALVHLFSLDMVGSDMLRQWIKAQGWYAYRRPLQLMVLALLGLALLVLSPYVWGHAMRRRCFWTWLCVLLAGVVWLCAMVRLVSWHTTDAFMSWPVAGLAAGRWLELSALAVILLVTHSRLASRWSWS